MKQPNDLNIFLVDDDIFCLNVYEQLLQNMGYKDISLYTNGTECLNQLTNEPDVIFLDYGMNSLNGLEVLKKIKRFNPDIYVVFLSGQRDVEIAVNSLKYGAFDYIVKDDQEQENIRKVLAKITEIKEVLKKSQPGLIKKIITRGLNF